MKVPKAFGRIARGISWVAGAKTSSAAFVHTLSARVFLIAINFGTGIIVARSLEAHGRGVQAAISIWPVVLSGLFTLGIPSALRFRIPRTPERAPEFLSASLVLALMLGVLGMIGGALFVPVWLSNYDPTSIRFAQFILLFIPGSLGLLMIQAYFEATANFQLSNAIVYIPPASTLVALATLALTHALTPFTSTLAYYVPTNVVFLVRLWTLRANITLPPVHFRERASSLISYGYKAFGFDVLATLSMQIDQALVVRFLSAPQLGIYAVSLAISRLLFHFSLSLTTILLPKAAALPPNEAIALVGRAARVTLGATAFGAIVLSTFTPAIVPFFYGRDFAEAGRLAQILFIEVTISSTVSVLAQAFLSTGRPGTVTALQGVGLATIVPFMIYGIPRYGLTGAAFALLASTAIRLIFVLLCFPILLKVAPPNIIPTPADVRFALSRLRPATKPN